MTAASFSPTGEQEAALALFGTGKSLAIEAGAGTGKTSTLVLLARSTRRRGQYVAFNKAIVTDAGEKMPSNVRANTAHSLAFKACGVRYKARLDASRRMKSTELAKILRIEAMKVTTWTGEEKRLGAPYLAGLVMRAVERFCQSADPEPTYRHVPFIQNLDRPAPADSAPQSYLVNNAVARAVEPALRRAWQDLVKTTGALPFQHSHYLKIWQLSGPRIEADFILFDEAQDANPVMVAIVAAQTHAQVVWVGDSCQPAGTLVQRVREPGSGKRPTITEEVPIEQIREGDLVVSYDVSTGHLHRRGNRVLGVSERMFDGSLVQIDAGMKWISNYTPDHHCVAKLGPAFKGKHLVYLMRRAGTGESYRVGRAAGSYTSGFGPLARAKAEGADALWILSAHETAAEAATAEALASHRYGIPMMLFRAAQNRLLSQDSIESFWSTVGDLTRQASECLEAHGRDVRFPLWHPGQGNLLMNRATTIRACNLMTGMLVPVIAAGCVEWAAGRIYRRTQDALPVYSMTVENDHTYVGDGIVTHNCQQIYTFTGAVNALANVPAEQRAFLTQSFRFGPAIADVANGVLDRLDAELRLTGTPSIPSVVQAVADPDAILTRTNAVAVRAVLTALEQGRKPFLVGGAGEILSFCRAARDLKNGQHVDHPELACFDSWAEVVEYVDFDEQGGDLRLMVKLIDEFGIDKILDALDRCSDERNADVVVSTAHKAKGREWGSVRLADDFPDQPEQEELRLLYVAATRAKLTLDITAVGYFGVAVEDQEPVPARALTDWLADEMPGPDEIVSLPSGEQKRFGDCNLADLRSAIDSLPVQS